jgi:hypothetical protein
MRLLRAIAVVVLLSLPAAARASIAMPLSVAALSQKADLVVRGTVLRQSAAWTRAGRIVTATELAVKEAWKGTPPEHLTVRHWGGKVDDVGQQVAGEVDFQDGEEVVLFLAKTRLTDGSYQVLGMAQGKFTVTATAGQVGAVQHLDGLATLKDGQATAAQPQALPVESLKQQVLSAQPGSAP